MDILKETLFPFSQAREEQMRMLEDVAKTVRAGSSLMAHAPTGIGKTAASLPPALAYALENGKTVFFLTPKHSQHRIVVDTLKRIIDRYDKKIISVDIIGKQWTCLYEGALELTSFEFNHFCKAHKRNETCRFYNKVYKEGTNELTKEAKAAIEEIKKKSPLHSEEILDVCKKAGLCPYEIATQVGKSANVVICDYYHLFHPHVRQAFLSKTGKNLEDLILIIDEAHNLPERVRKLMSSTLSEYTISNALKEAAALREENLEEDLNSLLKVLKFFGKKLKKDEMFIKKEEFVSEIESDTSEKLDFLVENLETLGESVLELPNRFRSYASSVAEFLGAWSEKRDELAYARIFNTYMSQTGRRYQISLKCLDPALYTQEVFSHAHASILMSGTLLPPDMYKTVLGIHNAKAEQYKNPFPPENRLVVITHGITTKYSQRSDYMWSKIAKNTESIIKKVPGSIAVFFPSYEILKTISKIAKIDKETLIEKQEMTKAQKHELYKRLAHLSQGKGGVLFAVQAGSFSEGMDFPGGMLDCVIVVGLPLEKPTLETEALITYYDFKFNRGWDYGYIYPAMNKALQAAGRCIRSEIDRGAIILMDDRFKWENYKKCMPKDMRTIVTEKPEMYLEKFFKPSSPS